MAISSIISGEATSAYSESPVAFNINSKRAKHILPNTVVPTTAADALKHWDAGNSLLSVEMSGFGPSIEQAVQIFAFEIIRDVLATGVEPPYEDSLAMRTFAAQIMAGVEMRCAQYNLDPACRMCAANLAYMTLRQGWAEAIKRPEVADRLIRVCKGDVMSAPTTVGVSDGARLFDDEE